MKYLFLDDERMPKDVTWIYIGGVGSRDIDWQIVRSFREAKDWVLVNGFPDVITFDSDGNTGYDFAKWLIEYDMDTNSMPRDFNFTVHSMNPVGSNNIQYFLNSYLRNKIFL